MAVAVLAATSKSTVSPAITVSPGPDQRYYSRVYLALAAVLIATSIIVQELCESRGGRPGLSVLTSLLVSVDVKLY